MKLYLVRHPAVLLDKGICYGSSDIAVSPQALAEVLAALPASLPTGAHLFSSPLQRCAELAQRLVVALNCTSLTLDARLAEMHFGAWELCAWEHIPRADIDAWSADLVAYQPGGGESVLQMAQRVQAFLHELAPLQQDCIVVCHAGTIRLLLACQDGGTLTDIARRAAQNSHQIDYGAVVLLQG